MLTDRRKAILQFIQNFFYENSTFPTIREICIHFKLKSTNGVYEHLKALERDGYISLDKRKSRGIRINFENINLRQLPLTGIVSAGEPIYPIVEEGDYIENVNNLIKGSFILKVRGNSMINAGINNGDLVSIDINREIKNNDIVVALVDGEVTLKRIRFNKDSILLLPENPEYKPVHVKNINFQILGKATMLIRKLD